MGTRFHSNEATEGSKGLDAFTAAYIMAAYWTSTGDNEQPSSEAELSAEARADAVAECEAFQRDNDALLTVAYCTEGYDEARAGHDFWLTRNGHGTGFWDRDLGEAGEALSEASRAAGGADLYEGDNGKLYF